MRSVITISRQIGTEGDLIAKRVASLLEYQYFDKTILTTEAKRLGIHLGDPGSIDITENDYEPRGIIDSILANTGLISAAEDAQMKVSGTVITELANKGNIVIVGRGGQALLKGRSDVLHVKIIAPFEDRIDNLMLERFLNKSEAERLIKKSDKATKKFLERFHNIDWEDSTYYDVIINVHKIPLDLAPTYIKGFAISPPGT